MQILLEKIENGDFIHTKIIGKFIKYNLLEKEKEVIIKTYNHAVLHGYLVQLGEDKPIDAQDYYEETFNTKEK